jgi:hypothetical protein
VASAKQIGVVPGTGLPYPAYAAIVVTSVAIFLVWGGPLWSSPADASHVGRFVVSYLAVIPLAALALATLHRLTRSHLVTATGTAWALKLLVTAALYLWLARGSNARAVDPGVRDRRSPAAAAVGTDREYRAVHGELEAGDITGSVVEAGRPVGGAIVFLDAPLSGRPLSQPHTLEIVIRESQYDTPLYLASVEDEVLVKSFDPVLHTTRLTPYAGLGVTASANQPIPPSGRPVLLDLPSANVFRIGCAAHPGELAFLVVVDHPYATRTDADGRFRLERVAAGPARVVAVIASEGALSRAERRVDVPAGGAAEVLVEIEHREHAQLTVPLETR